MKVCVPVFPSCNGKQSPGFRPRQRPRRSVLLKCVFACALLLILLPSKCAFAQEPQVYSHLWTDSLREETPVLPPDGTWACHIEMLGGCSEEDIQLYLKYYADEASREQWQEHFPNDPLPAREKPPYDRDRLLPKPDDFRPASRDPN